MLRVFINYDFSPDDFGGRVGVLLKGFDERTNSYPVALFEQDDKGNIVDGRSVMVPADKLEYLPDESTGSEWRSVETDDIAQGRALKRFHQDARSDLPPGIRAVPTYRELSTAPALHGALGIDPHAKPIVGHFPAKPGAKPLLDDPGLPLRTVFPLIPNTNDPVRAALFLASEKLRLEPGVASNYVKMPSGEVINPATAAYRQHRALRNNAVDLVGAPMLMGLLDLATRSPEDIRSVTEGERGSQPVYREGSAGAQNPIALGIARFLQLLAGEGQRAVSTGEQRTVERPTGPVTVEPGTPSALQRFLQLIGAGAQ